MADGVWKGVYLSLNKFFDPSAPSIIKANNVEKKGKRKEKNGVFSGHYVIASSLPPKRRPLERRTLVPILSNTGIRGWGCKSAFSFDLDRVEVSGWKIPL